MTLGKEQRVGASLTPKETSLHNCSLSDSLGSESSASSLYSNVIRDLSSIGSVYGTTTQMEDYSVDPTKLTSSNFVYLPFYSELNDIEDTFINYKNLSYLFTKASTPTLALNSVNFGARSYISVFNTFRSDFNDFM